MADAVPAATPAYRKLTRMHRGVGTMTQLWMGPDHLLLVLSTGYTETYRRFYLRDIQSLLIVHTSRRLYYWLGIGLPLALIAAIMWGSGAGPIAFVVLAVIGLPLLLWNHLLGPGCSVVIVTAVQQEKLPSLSRLRKARRVLDGLRERIVESQAGLERPAPEPAVASTTSAPPIVVGAVPPPLPPPLPPS